jgi:NAD(P)-dependent dehydrogenase (short-subunit alcohol dehydrogenase family)
MKARMSGLAGHVALVTGSSRSSGKAIAIRLVAEGADDVVNGRSREHCEQTAQKILEVTGRSRLVLVGDVTDKPFRVHRVPEAVRRFGFIDILVNNAWNGTRINRLENKTDEMVRAAFEMALYPALDLMNATFPMMRDRGWGRTISVASLNGVNAHVYTVDYITTKEALRTLTRSAAREWLRYGAVANIICPGARSDALSEIWGD